MTVVVKKFPEVKQSHMLGSKCLQEEPTAFLLQNCQNLSEELATHYTSLQAGRAAMLVPDQHLIILTSRSALF